MRYNLYRNKFPRGCVVTRANAADIYTVRTRSKIKAAGGYMTMGGYQTMGLIFTLLSNISTIPILLI
jgi:hypothetical protein